jgi:hypothetical protein
MLALRNHGKSENGKNNSSSASSSQKPCFETCVISTREVGVPGMVDFLQVNGDESLRFLDLTPVPTAPRVHAGEGVGGLNQALG